MHRTLSDAFKNKNIPTGEHKVYIQFTIDQFGNIKDIDARSKVKFLESEIIKVLIKLPQFIPGNKYGETIAVRYVLPIIIK